MSRALLSLVSLTSFACASTSTVRIESSIPSRVFAKNGIDVVCEQTPCSLTFSRETCWAFDSSSGFVVLVARAGDREQTVAVETCEVSANEVIRFDFAVSRESQRAETDR